MQSCLNKVQSFLDMDEVPQEKSTSEVDPQKDGDWPVNGLVKFTNMTVRYRPTTD